MATLDYQLSVDMGLVITREEAECQIIRKVEIPKAWQRENQKQVTGAIIFSMKSHRISTCYSASYLLSSTNFIAVHFPCVPKVLFPWLQQCGGVNSFQ